MNGSSIRLIMEAMRSFVSSFSSSLVWPVSAGNVLRARLPPSTTKINGTATPPLWPIALVTEFLKKVPLAKKNFCSSGTEATTIAINIAHSGGFMKDQTPTMNLPRTVPILAMLLCSGLGKAQKTDLEVAAIDRNNARVAFSIAIRHRTGVPFKPRGTSSIVESVFDHTEGKDVIRPADFILPLTGVGKRSGTGPHLLIPPREAVEEKDDACFRFVAGVCRP